MKLLSACLLVLIAPSLCLAATPPAVADAVSMRVVSDPGLGPKLAAMPARERGWAVQAVASHFSDAFAHLSCEDGSCVGGWVGLYAPVAPRIEPPLPDDLGWWLGFYDYFISGPFAAQAGVETPAGCVYVRTVVVLRTAKQDDTHNMDEWVARTSSISGLACADGSFKDLPVPPKLAEPDAYPNDRLDPILKTVPGP